MSANHVIESHLPLWLYLSPGHGRTAPYSISEMSCPLNHDSMLTSLPRNRTRDPEEQREKSVDDESIEYGLLPETVFLGQAY